MPLYDKPIWQLMEEALKELHQTFSSDEMVRWFRQYYPKIQAGSVRAHLRAMSINVPSARESHPSIAQHAIFFKLDRGRYTRYDPAVHGPPPEPSRVRETGDQGLDDEEEEPVSVSSELSEFALELHLEEFMEHNWKQIDFGRPLEIWGDSEGLSGRQYPTDVGPIDFLCLDPSSNAFVVVELKKGRTSDRVIGQTQRYMGWVKRNLAAEGQRVEGLIIASDVDMKLQYALEVTDGISARRYRVSFELSAPGDPFER